MAYENVEFTQGNFCIAPILGTFATVDTSNSSSFLRIKNDTGGTLGAYSFNPNILQDTIIYGLEYVGPRDQNNVKDGMCFFTLESDIQSSCTIKRWSLDLTNSRLNMIYEYTKIDDTYDKYISSAFTVGKYFTTFNTTTTSGTGFIELTSVDTIISGTNMFLGPSTNGSYLGAYEEVVVTSVSGTTVFIDSVQGTPTFNYYNSGDPVTYLGNTYIFSDRGYEGDSSKGSIFTLNTQTGQVLDRYYSALFKDVIAARYAIPVYDTIGIIKNSELLYIDIYDFEIKKSNRLNNTSTDKITTIEVHSVEFDVNTIYRLQNKTTLRNDLGDNTLYIWQTYNYHKDGFFRYVDALTLYTNPTGILANQATTDVYVKVIDQYGMGVSNKTVTFSKIYGDTNGGFVEVNKQAITDINGIGIIEYISGWFDQGTIDTAEEDILIKAYTDGSNILTGSVYVWTELIFKLKAKFLTGPQIEPYGMPIITQQPYSPESINFVKQLSDFNSELVAKTKSCFGFPYGDMLNCSNGTAGSTVWLVRQLSYFSSTVLTTQKESFLGEQTFSQTEDYSDTLPVSQTYISRHHSSGNEDTVQIAQFRFMLDMLPQMFSEKNSTSTTIWVRLAPYGYDLDKSTLKFLVREVSHAGDTGFVDYFETTNLEVIEFDAGGGLIGLDITYTPTIYFYNNAIVYVKIEIYDNAVPKNIIEFDYWFLIIDDYNAPFILNENPDRNAENVPIDTEIYFEIIDQEVGVNIDSLEFYINNRIKSVSHTTISGGYAVTFENNDHFYYNQNIEVSVKVEDTSDLNNTLYDMWKFICEPSAAPYIDFSSVTPKNCSYGAPTRTTYMGLNIYEEGNGIDLNKLYFIVDGILAKNLDIKPIIRRIK